MTVIMQPTILSDGILNTVCGGRRRYIKSSDIEIDSSENSTECKKKHTKEAEKKHEDIFTKISRALTSGNLNALQAD